MTQQSLFPVGPEARAVAEGLNRDSTAGRFLGGKGDPHEEACPNCDEPRRRVSAIIGSMMHVRCDNCHLLEVKQRPRAR